MENTTTTLTPELQEAVETFIEYHNPERTCKLLRAMLMEALKHDLLTEELYFNDLVYDLDGLFSLLETMSGKRLLPEQSADDRSDTETEQS